MKTPWGKDRQGEFTIANHIGEGQKKLLIEKGVFIIFVIQTGDQKVCTRFHCRKYSLLIEEVVYPGGSGHQIYCYFILFEKNRMIIKSRGCHICVVWF